jgi:hypothetical protein
MTRLPRLEETEMPFDPYSAGAAIIGGGLIKHGSGGNRLAHVSADALQGQIENEKSMQDLARKILAIGLGNYGYNLSFTPPTQEELKANKFAAPTPNLTNDPNWNPLAGGQYQNQLAQVSAQQAAAARRLAPVKRGGEPFRHSRRGTIS